MFLNSVHPSLCVEKILKVSRLFALNITHEQTCRSMELSSAYLITLKRCVAPSLNCLKVFEFFITDLKPKIEFYYAHVNEK